MVTTGTDVIVVGAGIIGLTTALCLVEAGYRTSVVARAPSSASTSAMAGAFWGPYLSAHNQTTRWSLETLAVLQREAARPETGVRLVRGLEAARQPVPAPDWLKGIEDFSPCPEQLLPAGFVTGWRYTVPIIDMPQYLSWLNDRLGDLGVGFEYRTLHSLSEPSLNAPVIVNCSGVGAKHLVPDHELTPVRGQLVVMENPGIHTFFADHDDDPETLVYLLPEGDRVILGGSIERNRTDPDVDHAVAAEIIRRCTKIEPALAGARVLEHRVGFRPGRARIRVEETTVGRRQVIHNYGHGGSGVSTAWGCASEVRSMVNNLFVRHGSR